MHTHIPTRPNGTVFQAMPLAKRGGKMVVAVTCSKCKWQVQGTDRPYAPIDVIMRHFAEKGWRIAARATTAMCPKCQQENEAAPSPDAAAISAEFERQRIAEEKRAAAEKAAAPVDPDTRDVARIRELVAALPRSKGGGTLWTDNPSAVAEIVGIFEGRPSTGRLRFMRDKVGIQPLVTAIYQFRHGLDAEGCKVWEELRAEMTARGIKWTPTDPREKLRRNKTDSKDSETMKPSANTNIPNTVTVDAERARVQVVRLLDAHFTVADGATAGQYADGWSDERVAKESGLALDLVKRTRSSAYGEIVDPRTVKIEAAIASLAEEAKAARAMLADLDTKIAGLLRQVVDLKRR